MGFSWRHKSNWTSSTAKPKLNTRKCFKNTIIKILAEKHTFDNSNSKSTVSEDFTMVNSKFWQKKNLGHKKHKKLT